MTQNRSNWLARQRVTVENKACEVTHTVLMLTERPEAASDMPFKLIVVTHISVTQASD